MFNKYDFLCCFVVLGCGPTADLSCTIPDLAEHTQYEISVETVVEYTAASSCVSKVNSSLLSFWTGLSHSSGTFNQLFLRILFYSCHVVSSDFEDLMPNDISLSTLNETSINVTWSHDAANMTYNVSCFCVNSDPIDIDDCSNSTENVIEGGNSFVCSGLTPGKF